MRIGIVVDAPAQKMIIFKRMISHPIDMFDIAESVSIMCPEKITIAFGLMLVYPTLTYTPSFLSLFVFS